MESTTLQFEWQIEDLKKKNLELTEKIKVIGEMLVQKEKKLEVAEKLAKEIMTFYPSCPKSVYLMAENFINGENLYE